MGAKSRFRALVEQTFASVWCPPHDPPMSDRSTADPTRELAELAALQAQLRALEHGAGLDPGTTPVSVAVRRRLTGMAVADQIRELREREALAGLQQLQQRAHQLAASSGQRARHRAEQHRRPPRPAGLPVLWSPEAILGFRVWNVADALYGARQAWPAAELTARCLRRPDRPTDDGVPHTEGCSRPPCGIYAVKRIDRLVDEVGLPGPGRRWAFGLVELTGKVVEHDRGYRARHARCIAAAVVTSRELIRVEGPLLTDLFRNPQHTLARILSTRPGAIAELPLGRNVADGLIGYLDEARLLHQATGSLPPHP